MTPDELREEAAYFRTLIQRVDPAERPLYHKGLAAAIEENERKAKAIDRENRRTDMDRSYP